MIRSRNHFLYTSFLFLSPIFPLYSNMTRSTSHLLKDRKRKLNVKRIGVNALLAFNCQSVYTLKMISRISSHKYEPLSHSLLFTFDEGLHQCNQRIICTHTSGIMSIDFMKGHSGGFVNKRWIRDQEHRCIIIVDKMNHYLAHLFMPSQSHTCNLNVLVHGQPLFVISNSSLEIESVLL